MTELEFLDRKLQIFVSDVERSEAARNENAVVLEKNNCTLKTEQKELKVICKATERSFKRKFEGKSDI